MGRCKPPTEVTVRGPAVLPKASPPATSSQPCQAHLCTADNCVAVQLESPSGRSYQTRTSQHGARHQEAVWLPAASRHSCRSPCPRVKARSRPCSPQGPPSSKVRTGLLTAPLSPNIKHLCPARLPHRGICESGTAFKLGRLLMAGVCSIPHWVATQQPSPQSPLLNGPHVGSLEPLGLCSPGSRSLSRAPWGSPDDLSQRRL